MSPRVGLDNHIIIRAAADIADESGLQAVTLATLAQRLNVRPPSLYNHVNGLSGIMESLTLHGLEQLHRHLALSLQPGQTEAEAIMAIAAAYSAFAKSHAGLYEATQKAHNRLSPAHPEAEQASAGIVKLVADVIRPFLQEDAGEETVIHAVRGFRSLLHGYSSLASKDGFGMPISINESFRYMIRAYTLGIRAT